VTEPRSAKSNADQNPTSSSSSICGTGVVDSTPRGRSFDHMRPRWAATQPRPDRAGQGDIDIEGHHTSRHRIVAGLALAKALARALCDHGSSARRLDPMRLHHLTSRPVAGRLTAAHRQRRDMGAATIDLGAVSDSSRRVGEQGSASVSRSPSPHGWHRHPAASA